MGTWSIISPTEHPLASIDQTGKATFQKHTADTVYTIQYEDESCGTITKDFTVKGCGGGDDPKPDCCVTPLDNIGQVCNTTKTAAQYFIDAGFACEGTHWWSGPLDGPDDAGWEAEGDNTGDGIRCTPSNLQLESLDSWITFEIDSQPHDYFKGWVHYRFGQNPNSTPRVGRVKVTLKNPENADREWEEGKPIGTPFCMGKSEGGGCESDKEMYVYVYQKGNSSPTTCTLDVKGNESAHLDPIPASGTTDFIPVGTYETTCEGNFGKPTPKEGGVDFVTEWKFEGDVVYAKANENTGEARSTKYNVTKGDANDDFTIDQDGTGATECTCSNANLSITGKTIEGVSNTRALVASYTSDCDLESLDNYGHVTGDSIVNQTGPGQYQFSNGNIYMPVSENTSSEQRSEVYQFCDERFTITQLGKCAITNFQVDPTVMRDGVELGGRVAYHLNICNSECNETVEFTFHNNGRVTTIHHYPPFTSSYISDSFWVESTVWSVGEAYFEVTVKGETKKYIFQIKP